MVRIDSANSVQAENYNTSGSGVKKQPSEEQMFSYTPDGGETTPANKPEVLSEKIVTVKGDDGQKYDAHEVTTRETDDKGKVWEVVTRTYTDASGQKIEDTIRTHVRTERFGKEDVEITNQISVHKTPKMKRVVDAEDSKYHHSEKITTTEYQGRGYTTKTEWNKSSKKKICKMPPGFSMKYLSKTTTISTVNLGDNTNE